MVASQVAGLPSLLFWADKVIAYGQPELSRWQQVLTNRYDHLLAGALHYSEDDAGEEAAQVIRAWWAAARAQWPDRCCRAGCRREVSRPARPCRF